MLKKKRFKKETLGKLNMFLHRKSYTAISNFIGFTKTSGILNIPWPKNLSNTKHYYNCYKKKYTPHLQHVLLTL